MASVKPQADASTVNVINRSGHEQEVPSVFSLEKHYVLHSEQIYQFIYFVKNIMMATLNEVYGNCQFQLLLTQSF